MPKQRVSTIMSIIFGILSTVFIIVAGYFWISLNNIKTLYTPIEATIIEVDPWEEEMVLEYEVGSITFYLETNSYNSNTQIGDTYTIYYNPSNPSDAHFVMDYTIFILTFGLVGGSFLVVVITLITIEIMHRKKKLICREQGRLIKAKVTLFKPTAMHYNSKQGYRMICEGYFEGTKTLFHSHIIYLNAHEVPTEEKIVEVYVINKKKYFVETSSLKNASEYDWLGENY